MHVIWVKIYYKYICIYYEELNIIQISKYGKILNITSTGGISYVFKICLIILTNFARLGCEIILCFFSFFFSFSNLLGCLGSQLQQVRSSLSHARSFLRAHRLLQLWLEHSVVVTLRLTCFTECGILIPSGGGGDLVTKSCPTLATPCSPLVSSVHGIFQARILEWVAISFSGDLPSPGFQI